jgi:hypothetical protein
MRRAAPNAIATPPELALIAHLPAAKLKQTIPVELEPVDPFAEPEPSEGAAIELATGRYVVVFFGLETERLSVHAAWPEAPESITDFLRESRLDPAAVEWMDPRIALVIGSEQNHAVGTRR